jgi:glycosyltransferase involved in cell wall biosynthesis
MIRIAVDTIVTRPPVTFRGLFEYTRAMLEQFRLLAPEYDVEVSAYVGSGFAPEITSLPQTAHYRTVVSPLMDSLRRWRFGGGALLIKRDGNDVLFTTHAETVSIPGTPFVVMLHDVDFLRYRQYSWAYTARLYALFCLAAHSGKLVLTNSECSKRDIVRFLHIPPEKVSVVYLGCKHDLYNEDPAIQGQAELRKQFCLDSPYILHHGTFQPRKNLLRLVRAYSQLISAGVAVGYDLVLAGNYGWNCEDVLRACREVKPPGRVVLTGFLEERQLAALVKGAYLSVVPSLWEGFCFPMVEAMACGVPTVVAENSCLPEISGGVLHYFNAESVDQMAAAIGAGLKDDQLRARLRRDGLRRAAEFNWERCARETLAAIKQVATASSQAHS